jgi:hypothetical protein
VAKQKAGGLESIVQPHDDYAHLMVGPHRRRVARAGAPALVRHLAFWKPLDWRTYKIEERPSRARSRDIDRAIAGIYGVLLALKARRIVRGLKTNGEIGPRRDRRIVLFDSFMTLARGEIVEREDEKNVTGPDAHRTIKLMFEWRGIAATLSFESHVEFVTVTSILDLSGAIRDSRKKTLLSEKMTVFSRLYRHLDSIARQDLGDDKECAGAHRYLYRQVWAEFENEILACLRHHSLGSTVADFRGLVLGVNYDLRKQGAEIKAGDKIIAKPLTRVSTTGEKKTNREYDPS